MENTGMASMQPHTEYDLFVNSCFAIGLPHRRSQLSLGTDVTTDTFLFLSRPACRLLGGWKVLIGLGVSSIEAISESSLDDLDESAPIDTNMFSGSSLDDKLDDSVSKAFSLFCAGFFLPTRIDTVYHVHHPGR